MENLSWDDLRVLLAIHRGGSLLVAGRTLGVSTSTAARRLDALEAAIGRRLVHRSQSGTELNPEALRMAQLAESLELGLDTLRRDRARLAGTLRVSVPDGMAHALTQALLPFQRAHPGIDLELMGDSRMVDMSAREADLAIRLARSSSSVLIEKRLAGFRFGLFASVDYIRRHLPARRLDRATAASHSFVGLDSRWTDLPHERWLRDLGATRFVFRSSSMEAVLEAVHQGTGLAALGEQDPRNERLAPVDTALAAPTQPCYLVYHRDLRGQPHIRAAVAAIQDYFARVRS